MAQRRTPAPWTKREDNLICRLRRKGLGLDEIALGLEEVAPRQPQRTREAISTRIQFLLEQGHFERMREPIPAGSEWTTEEDSLLIKLRKRNLTAAAMVAHFPRRRTEDAIAARARQLAQRGQLKRRGPNSRKLWSDEEKLKLRQLCEQKKSRKEIASALRRTVQSVNARIALLRSHQDGQ